MRTEEAPCTVLHRLIQEQLRYGNPTDTRTLLAIQQQALRIGVNGGPGSSRSSPGSLSREERQEPQGQEHHTDFQHSEIYGLHHHHEQLPTYEQARANSQFLAPQWYQDGQICLEDSKQSHGRSLSERLMQLSVQRKELLSVSSSCSYPQIAGYRSKQQMQHNHQGTTQEVESFYLRPPPPSYSQHNRIIPHVQTPEAHHALRSPPPAGREVSLQMELLAKENERLRRELEGHTEKACRIQKLEQEVRRISEAYETLMQGCVKRESLEQTLRSKLTSENKRLQDMNTELRESLERSGTQAEKDAEAAEHTQRVIAKLLLQKEEQQLNCTRLEREVQLLREESSSAQARGRRLRAELQRKNAYVEHVERLQGALAQLQATCEKRESLELRLRTRLEQELRILRNQQRQTQGSAGGIVPASSASLLQERLREREERILALEADMTRWQQKYLEEKTMMEFAMDAAATAAAQRDTTIINHSPCQSSRTSFSEDLPPAGVRGQEVENRIRSLYRQVMEKDAVINVLQHRLQQGRDKGEAGEGVSPSDTSSSQDEGSGQTDVQTAGGPEQDSRTRSRPEPVKQKLVDPFVGLDDVKAEALEIFI
ncbi:angiomotin-like protein 2b [Trichomycterus rosablanca]|uniref:angiomotin-like protein 2b n=1 Tax=Trichomycterus rosablanca TaxID=2290929 RepID=UPI002F35F812